MTNQATPDHATQLLREMVADRFGRIRDAVHTVTEGLSDTMAAWRPDPDANSIAWLVWHLSRVQDDHVAGLTGAEQVWTADGFYERFALPFPPEVHGYGHSSAEVAEVRPPASLLEEYHAAVHERCLAFAGALTAADLTKVVDASWDPPVTAAVRLVSLLGDGMQHVGQAAYVRGLAERAGVV